MLEELSAQGLNAAMEANSVGYLTYFAARTPGMRVVDEGDLLLVDSGVVSDTFNYICRAQLNVNQVQARTQEAISYFTARGLPVAWWVGPASQPGNLGVYLEQAGLDSVEVDEGMVADLRALPRAVTVPEDLSIQRVSPSQQLEQFAQAVSRVFEPPDTNVHLFYKRVEAVALSQDGPLRLFLGYWRGEPVATSAVFLNAGVAGIYSVATAPHARKRGIGTALTLAALQDAQAVGYTIGVLQASGEGQRIYQRLGFRTTCLFKVYQ
jgi:ribosomal protein S18 acetylase RimI-like enzyme